MQDRQTFVGAAQVGAVEGRTPLLHAVLPRLVAIAARAPALHLQWEAAHARGLVERLIGVASEAPPPRGLQRFELTRRSLAVGRAAAAPLAWSWGGPSTGGDFVRARDHAAFRLVASAWFGLPTPDDVCLVDPDPAWPTRFAVAATDVRARLGADVAGRIEHFGSTAVPGLAAKPVLDMLVEVVTADAGRRAAFGAFHGPNVEVWVDREHTLVILRDPATRQRTHHLHLVPAGHPRWEGLRFRDRLRADPATAARYLTLKQELAARHAQDREAYTAGKASFVDEVLATSR